MFVKRNLTIPTNKDNPFPRVTLIVCVCTCAFVISHHLNTSSHVSHELILHITQFTSQEYIESATTTRRVAQSLCPNNNLNSL